MDSRLITLMFLISLCGVAWKSVPVFSAWWRARRSAAPLSLLTVWGLFFRNVPLDALVDAHVFARRAGVAIRLREMVDHARVGGDIRAVVEAYIETLQAGIDIEFARVCEIELEDAEAEQS